MTILITGGCGFIGDQLAKKFAGRGNKIVLFDKTVTEENAINDPLITTIKGDVTNFHEILNVVKQYKPDCIFHLAAILSGVSESNPWGSININALGTYHVLEAARLFNCGKIVFSSSMGSYTVDRDTIVDEQTKQTPQLIYGVTKVFGELLGLYYQRKFGIDFRGIRFPQLIGPNVKTFGFGQYNPWMIEAAIKGETFDVWAPEDTILPLLYIKDAIRSLIMLYDADEANLKTRVYNIGQILPAPTAADMANEVRKYFPNAEINFKPDPAAEIGLATIPKRIKGDVAEQEWGWHVKYNLADTVKDFINSYNH